MTQISAILATNGGPHPADKWAEATSDAIVDTILVDVNPNDGSEAAVAARLAKRALRENLFQIFMTHHAGVQRGEQSSLKKFAKKPQDAAAVLLGEHDPMPYRDDVMAKVNAAFGVTPYKDHFAKPEVQALVWQIIGQHTVDVMHIERRWHHDRMTKGA